MSLLRVCIVLAVLFEFTVSSFAETDAYYIGLYDKAKKAIQRGDKPTADFYLARYMGLTGVDKRTTRNFTDLYPLFKGYKVSKPISFISGKYSDDFIKWFVFGSSAQWGIDEQGVDEKNHSFEIASGDDGKYFVSIVAFPYLEGWSLIKGDKPSTLVMALGSFEKKPYIVSGMLDKNKPVKYFKELNLDMENHPLQYVWTPEFHDLDNDGVPEIWIRYNKAWGDGFSQELAIYKIQKDKLTLFKKFSGEAEGIARRLKDGTVEVGQGFTNKEATGHLGYDQHHLEIWACKDGKFVKISERDVPHLLWLNEWKKYYLE